MEKNITVYNVLIAALMIPEINRRKKMKGNMVLNVQDDSEKPSDQKDQKQIKIKKNS